MAATWTKAGQVRRTFKAGRPLQKDRALNPEQAIFEACMLLGKLRDAMSAPEFDLDPNDVQAALVVEGQESGHTFVYTLRIPEPKQVGRLFETVEKIKTPVMYGIVFSQLDREMAAKNPSKATATWVYPFRVSQPSQQVFAKALESLARRVAKTEFS